jgi:HEAT repeat protein
VRREPTLTHRYLEGQDDSFRSIPFVRRALRRLRSLEQRGIRTVPDLIAVHPGLPPRSREFATWALGVLDDRRAVPLLLRVFRDAPALRMTAATALGILGGSRAYAFAVATLRSALRDADAPADLVDAAVLLVVYMPGERDRLLADPSEPVLLLVTVLSRTDLSGWARGEAASGLGHLLEGTDHRRRRWREAARALRKALSDSDPFVRHEAAHAVGDLRLQPARRRLRAMARGDRGKGPWGSVAREARAALFAIEHGDRPAWWWNAIPCD